MGLNESKIRYSSKLRDKRGKNGRVVPCCPAVVLNLVPLNKLLNIYISAFYRYVIYIKSSDDYIVGRYSVKN